MFFWFLIRQKHALDIIKNKYKIIIISLYKNIKHSIYAEIYRNYKGNNLKIFLYFCLATKEILFSLILNRNKNKTKEFVKEVVSYCLSNDIKFWWNDLENLNAFTLQNIYRNISLRKIGNVDKFLYFEKKYKDEFFFRFPEQEFYTQISNYFLEKQKEIVKISKNKRYENTFLISFSCWGKSYIDSFLAYCLPSLMANGNLPYLVTKRKVIINIYTNEDGKKTFVNSQMVKNLKKIGISVIFQMLENDLIKNISTNLDHRYWHLGMIQSLSLYMAKKLNADFHLLMPDTIYSENHMKAIIKASIRGNEVITSLGLSTVKEKMQISIRKYKARNGIISVPASDLASLSIQNIHLACKSWLSTNKNLENELPNLFMIAWESYNSLHMMSPHQTILYISRKIMAKIKDRLFLTLDGELDTLIPKNAIIYTPQREDDMYLIEMTSKQQQRFVKDKRNDISEFCRLFWYSAQNSKGYLRFASKTIVIPLNRAIISNRGYMQERDIKSSQITLLDSIIENYPFPEKIKIDIAVKLLEEIIEEEKTPNIKTKANQTLAFLNLQTNMLKEFKEFHSIQFTPKTSNKEHEIIFLKKVKSLLNIPKNVPDSEIYVARNLSRYEKYFQENNLNFKILNLDKIRIKRHKTTVPNSDFTSPIGSLYKEAIKLCIKNKIDNWHDYILNYEEDSIPQLFFFIRECIFRTIGDYQKYLSFIYQIQKMGIPVPKIERCYVDCAIHFKSVIERINNNLITKNIPLNDKQEKRIVIGLSCWGKDFIESFLELCLPSLMSRGNLCELVKHRQVIFFIHTNEEGMSLISMSKIVRNLEVIGVNIIYELINNKLVNYIKKDQDFKYWHLGMCQSIELNIASKLNADYHLLMPDTIYSENHFKGIIKLINRDKKVITRLMLSAKKEKINEELINYKNKNNVISISASDLCSICLKHISVLSENWLITNKDINKDMPSDPFIVFESKTSLKIFAAHQTILFLSEKIVKRNKQRFFAALDSELDLLIPSNADLYLPQTDDEVFVIALNSESRKLISEPNDTLSRFTSKFWLSCKKSKSSWRFFDKSTTDRINRKLLPNREFMKKEDINYTSELIKKELLYKFPKLTSDDIRRKKKIASAI